MRKVLFSAMIGNGLEWYDYALYGQMAFILSKLFFPSIDPFAQLMATFGVFAVGFVFRPLGAVLFGYIGDTYGRKRAMVIAILMMAIPTGCIGLLPTFEQIGIAAPILLTIIRIFQGLSLGGEFSGSIAYAVEHSPPQKRGWIGAMSLVSLILGFLLGLFVSMAFAWSMPVEDFESWGWRVPFLLGIVIGFVGLYIRNSCEESPCYEAAKANGHLSKKPVREAFARHPWPMLQAFGIYITITMPFYLLSIYFITFTEKELGLTHREALTINTCVMLTMLVVLMVSSRLSDHHGRRTIMMLGAAAMMLVAYPAFTAMLDTPTFAIILLAQVAIAATSGFYMGPVAAVLVELFPTSVRYTGMAIGYNLSAAIFGGTTPMVCTWLIQSTGTSMSIAWYVMACNLVSLTVLWGYKDRWRETLR